MERLEPMMFKFCVYIVLGTIVLTGCGDSGPVLVPVEGTVTLDGKPLANKSLMFVPIDETLGHGAGGSSDARANTRSGRLSPARQETTLELPRDVTASTFLNRSIAINAPVEEDGDEPAVAIGPGVSRGRSGIPPSTERNDRPWCWMCPSRRGTEHRTKIESRQMNGPVEKGNSDPRPTPGRRHHKGRPSQGL